MKYYNGEVKKTKVFKMILADGFLLDGFGGDKIKGKWLRIFRTAQGKDSAWMGIEFFEDSNNDILAFLRPLPNLI